MGTGRDETFDRGLSSTASDPDSAEAQEPGTADGFRYVRQMTQNQFRRRLIEHFDILWRQGKVQWPSRNGNVEWARA